MKKPTAFDGVGAWMRTWLEPVVSGRLPSVTCSICTTGGRGSPVDTTSGLSDQALSRSRRDQLLSSRPDRKTDESGRAEVERQTREREPVASRIAALRSAEAAGVVLAVL